MKIIGALKNNKPSRVAFKGRTRLGCGQPRIKARRKGRGSEHACSRRSFFKVYPLLRDVGFLNPRSCGKVVFSLGMFKSCSTWTKGIPNMGIASSLTIKGIIWSGISAQRRSTMPRGENHAPSRNATQHMEEAQHDPEIKDQCSFTQQAGTCKESRYRTFGISSALTALIALDFKN